MSFQSIRAAASRPLEILDISESEERAYRWLIVHPGAVLPEVARALTLSPGKAQRLLNAIEAKGLVTCTPERPRRYIPVSPDIAMEALALKRQEDLRRARQVIQEIQEAAAAVQPLAERELMVELVTSREAVRQIFEQMQSSARREVISLIRAPVLISNLDEEKFQNTQREAQAKGVCYRSIVDAEFLDSPDVLHVLQEDMKAGEEIKVIKNLPFKMILSDHRIALIPLNPHQAESSSLVVRSSTLLDALYALFEILWERAIPASFTSKDGIQAADFTPHLSEEAESLFSLMATGLNDKTIAAELGISSATLTRRIARVMKFLGVRTRFQAGWFARGLDMSEDMGSVN